MPSFCAICVRAKSTAPVAAATTALNIDACKDDDEADGGRLWCNLAEPSGLMKAWNTAVLSRRCESRIICTMYLGFLRRLYFVVVLILLASVRDLYIILDAIVRVARRTHDFAIIFCLLTLQENSRMLAYKNDYSLLMFGTNR